MQTAERIAYLLDELCTGLGFCLPPAAREHLKANPPADPGAFAAAVFCAEGLDPAADRRLYQQVHDAVTRGLSGSAPSGA
jgi:hypothetical protein